jgi:LysM repeat protein
MHKWIVPILAISLCFGACGGGGSDDSPEDDTTPTASVVKTETQVVEEPTPTAIIVVPPKAPLIYTVQAGDSLGIIANSFGVAIEDLAAKNGIENYNIIVVGQELIIPDEDEDEDEE